jgi:hypothetical protein
VFYDKGNNSDGWRYLEAAPASTEFRAQWGAYTGSFNTNNYWGINIPGTQTDIGMGRRNTQIIVERLRQLGESGRAAQVASSLNFNGFTDWFIPSKDELDLMYQNRQRIGGFQNAWYWSSSQSSTSNAWIQGFWDGSQPDRAKINIYGVRAVRAF